MVGNERNRITDNKQFKANLKDQSAAVNLKGDTLNRSMGNIELDRYYTVDERSSIRSEASTQVVQFQGVDHKDNSIGKEKELPPIPDGGWGWVVVVAAFLVSVCSDGLAYSFGNLHDEFINYFQQSHPKTSWIGSLFIAVPLISGPIMSALVEQYGCRAMTMAASIVATGGFLLAAISNSVELLYLTLGIISGLAMGILYITSVASVAFWFDKRRTLAVAIASSGIGFGTVIFGPLTDFLLNNYDWRGTIVILSCTILNMSVCGALMREPDWVIIKELREAKRKKAQKAKLNKSPSIASISVKSMGGETIVLSLNEISDLIKNGQSPEHILSMLTSAVAESEELEAVTQMNVELTRKRNNSAVDLPTFIYEEEEVPPEVMDKIMTNKSLYNIILQNYPHLIKHRRSEANITMSGSSNRNSHDSGLHFPSLKTIRPASADLSTTDYDIASVDVTIDNKSEGEISSKRDINNNLVYTNPVIKPNNHGLNDQIIYRNPIVYHRALVKLPQYRLRASSLPDIYKNSSPSLWSKSERKKKWYDSIMKLLRDNFNFKLFTEFHFLMFNISSVLMSIWSIIPFFYLKSYMSDIEMEGYANIIVTMGISTGAGVIILGWLGDQPWYNVTKSYIVCLSVCGISVAVFPLVIEDMPLLIFISAIFGLSFASTYSYTPAILMELVPIEHFTVAYGMILLSQGIGNLIGPPIAGLIFSSSDSWDLVFFVGGAWLVVSGLCVAAIVFIKNVRICGSDPLLNDVAAQNQAGPDKV